MNPGSSIAGFGGDVIAAAGAAANPTSANVTMPAKR